MFYGIETDQVEFNEVLWTYRHKGIFILKSSVLVPERISVMISVALILKPNLITHRMNQYSTGGLFGLTLGGLFQQSWF